jgi:hypothetical protein
LGIYSARLLLRFVGKQQKMVKEKENGRKAQEGSTKIYNELLCPKRDIRHCRGGVSSKFVKLLDDRGALEKKKVEHRPGDILRESGCVLCP